MKERKKRSFVPGFPSPAKAQAMAYAEKPYRDMALNAKAADNKKAAAVLDVMALLAAQKAELAHHVSPGFVHDLYEDTKGLAPEVDLAYAIDNEPFFNPDNSLTDPESVHIIRTANGVVTALDSESNKLVWITNTTELQEGSVPRSSAGNAERLTQGITDIENILRPSDRQAVTPFGITTSIGVYESPTNLGVNLIEKTSDISDGTIYGIIKKAS